MRAHVHGRRGRRSGEIPWLLVATILGIAVVVIVALVFFTGLGGSPSASHATTGTPSGSSSGSSSASSSSTPAASSTTKPVVATQTPVTISSSGVIIKVDYIGGFSGTYTAGGNTTKIKDSGTKTYTINSVTGPVVATVKKNDNTATHALTVTIFKDGKQMATNSTSAANGAVTVQATV